MSEFHYSEPMAGNDVRRLLRESEGGEEEEKLRAPRPSKEPRHMVSFIERNRPC